MLTRGLPDALARNLLTYGFAEAVIRKIGIDSIREDLDAAISILEQNGWVKVESAQQKDGRPMEVIRINPHILSEILGLQGR